MSIRLPKSVLKRYSEILLRHVYQAGGRDRYVPVMELEDTLGLEEALILRLCRTRLRGELIVANRLPKELEEGSDFHTAQEREWMRYCFARPHVRVRPDAVRLTERELLVGLKRPKRRKRKKKRRR